MMTMMRMAAARFLSAMAPPREGTSPITLLWGDQGWAVDIRPASPSASSR